MAENRAANIYLSDITRAHLETLVKRWGVSRSGAIARAVQLAAEQEQDS